MSTGRTRIRSMFKLLMVICIWTGIGTWVFQMTQPDPEPWKPEEGLPPLDKVVIGRFAGECYRDCVEILRITPTELSKDHSNRILSQREDYEFGGARAYGKDHSTLKWVLNVHPPEIFWSLPPIVGCPDCTDSGGFYLSITCEGETHSVLLDPFRLPDEMLGYVEVVFGNVFGEIFVQEIPGISGDQQIPNFLRT
jgi:hypothetical protein